jgi:hypothetical protein
MTSSGRCELGLVYGTGINRFAYYDPRISSVYPSRAPNLALANRRADTAP